MRSLILIRGLPGSGKNSVASAMGITALAADDFFITPEGEYNFDATKLAMAHATCQLACRQELLADGVSVVANTFSQRWELEPYFQIAKKLEARVWVLDLYDGGLTDVELTERNAHGAPLGVIQNMRARWEVEWKAGDPLPPWER